MPMARQEIRSPNAHSINELPGFRFMVSRMSIKPIARSTIPLFPFR